MIAFLSGFAAASVGLGEAGASAAAGPRAITLAAAPTAVTAGSPVTVSGSVSGARAGTIVQLLASPYPYGTSAAAGTTTTAADGSYGFRLHPDRNVRLRAVVPATGAAAQTDLAVNARVQVSIRTVPFGQAEVTILAFHPPDLPWSGGRVGWLFAGAGGRRFVPAQPTVAYGLDPNIAVLRTRVSLAAGRFSFRACFHPAQPGALGDPVHVPGCAGRGYLGGGYMPVGFPAPGAVSRARAYLSHRVGRTAFAVVDSEGRLSGVHIHWRFPTASVVKAMLLVAYLRRLDARGQHQVDASSNSFLYPMIHVSDNAAATRCWSIVGDGGLYAIARAARMADFSVSGSWGTALLSPADQAHYFFAMDSLVPRAFVGYARFLLSTIAASQSWGIPRIARPLGYRTFFKDGSQPTGLGQLVHQVDRLEGHHRRLAIAVMTDGDPTRRYGIATIQGVAGALLR
jgi:hypothetical protein